MFPSKKSRHPVVRTRTRISQGVYGSQFFAGRFLCVNRVSHFLRQIPVQWQIFIFISRLWRTISFKLCWTACNMHNRLRIHCWSIGERRSTNSSSLCLSSTLKAIFTSAMAMAMTRQEKVPKVNHAHLLQNGIHIQGSWPKQIIQKVPCGNFK